MTIESLPPENSSAGRSNSAATSRMTWMLSASSTSSWSRASRPVMPGPVAVSSASSCSTDSCCVCSCVGTTASGAVGGSYGRVDAGQPGELPRCAAGRRAPSRRARCRPRPGSRRAPPGSRRPARRAGRARRRGSRRTGEMTLASTSTPCRARVAATQPIRSTLVSRSARLKPEALGQELAHLVAVEQLDPAPVAERGAQRRWPGWSCRRSGRPVSHSGGAGGQRRAARSGGAGRAVVTRVLRDGRGAGERGRSAGRETDRARRAQEVDVQPRHQCRTVAHPISVPRRGLAPSATGGPPPPGVAG